MFFKSLLGFSGMFIAKNFGTVYARTDEVRDIDEIIDKPAPVKTDQVAAFVAKITPPEKTSVSKQPAYKGIIPPDFNLIMMPSKEMCELDPSDGLTYRMYVAPTKEFQISGSCTLKDKVNSVFSLCATRYFNSLWDSRNYLSGTYVSSGQMTYNASYELIKNLFLKPFINFPSNDVKSALMSLELKKRFRFSTLTAKTDGMMSTLSFMYSFSVYEFLGIELGYFTRPRLPYLKLGCSLTEGIHTIVSVLTLQHKKMDGAMQPLDLGYKYRFSNQLATILNLKIFLPLLKSEFRAGFRYRLKRGELKAYASSSKRIGMELTHMIERFLMVKLNSDLNIALPGNKLNFGISVNIGRM